MALSIEAAVVIFWLVRLLSALCSNISDCDETYNYWEPVGNVFRFGLQQLARCVHVLYGCVFK